MRRNTLIHADKIIILSIYLLKGKYASELAGDKFLKLK